MLASFYLIIIDINEKIKLPLKPNDYNKKKTNMRLRISS
jgi:hypothetical protein